MSFFAKAGAASLLIASATALASLARARAALDTLARGLDLFTDAVVGAASTACDAAATGIDTAAGVGASGATKAATKIRKLENWLVEKFRQDDKTAIDGAFIDENCRPKKKAGGGVPAVKGKRPACGGYDGMPKAVYTNGIQTDQVTACIAMAKLAESRCLEVVGIYNATEGMMGDLAECVENINRAGTAPAVLSQRAYLHEQLADPNGGEILMFAHSQGGLITQESLVSVEQDLLTKHRAEGLTKKQARIATEKQMGRVKVYSFGTAENGWPDGPSYQRYTNTSDPVPKVIAAAQSNKPDMYPPKGDPPGSPPPHRFTESKFNPIGAHDMNEVYIRELDRNEPHDRSGCRCAA